jgi:hypothetical protein
MRYQVTYLPMPHKKQTSGDQMVYTPDVKLFSEQANEHLNKAAEAGWRLVSAVPVLRGHSSRSYKLSTEHHAGYGWGYGYSLTSGYCYHWERDWG